MKNQLLYLFSKIFNCKLFLISNGVYVREISYILRGVLCVILYFFTLLSCLASSKGAFFLTELGDWK